MGRTSTGPPQMEGYCREGQDYQSCSAIEEEENHNLCDGTNPGNACFWPNKIAFI